MHIGNYLIALLFVGQITLANDFSDSTKSNVKYTISKASAEDFYLQDSSSLAGLGIGAHFAERGAIYERMLIMLTTEYRFKTIPSFLLEFQWWNADEGKKNLLLSVVA